MVYLQEHLAMMQSGSLVVACHRLISQSKEQTEFLKTKTNRINRQYACSQTHTQCVCVWEHACITHACITHSPFLGLASMTLVSYSTRWSLYWYLGFCYRGSPLCTLWPSSEEKTSASITYSEQFNWPSISGWERSNYLSYDKVHKWRNVFISSEEEKTETSRCNLVQFGPIWTNL